EMAALRNFIIVEALRPGRALFNESPTRHLARQKTQAADFLGYRRIVGALLSFSFAAIGEVDVDALSGAINLVIFARQEDLPYRVAQLVHPTEHNSRQQ